MKNGIINDVEKRHDFVILFDVTDGNPNGDPDAGNLPRVDPETMEGLVTDVCLKRKVRNYAAAHGKPIYIQSQVALNTLHDQSYQEIGKGDLTASTKKKPPRDVQQAAKERMCANFYDIRVFGAVMTTEVNCGQVRGPVQLTFARSIDPVVPMDLSITRIAITKPADAKYAEEGGKETEMGRKPIVPYGLYKGYGFFSPALAKSTEVTQEDLKLFWEALENMWDLDRSAARGMMAIRGLYVFSHDSYLGNAPAHKLFDRVQVNLKDGVKAPRSFGDYVVSVDGEGLPQGITLTRVVE